MPEFEISENEDSEGNVLILKGAWSDDISKYMLKEKIYALRLTDSFGFKGNDLSFIPSLSFLKSLELYCWEAKDIKVIESLPQLENIGLQFKSTKKIDFSDFKNLKVAKLTWAKGLESLLGLNTIQYLNVQNYPYTTLKPIAHMVKLRKLYLTSRKLETLDGIDNLENLEELDLYNCQKLISKTGIEKVKSLKAVTFEACGKLNA